MQNGVAGIDYAHKENFQWISLIRLPEFVTRDDFEWAIREATAKKKQDFSKVEFLTYDEGLCVQCMRTSGHMMRNRKRWKLCTDIWKNRVICWISQISGIIMRYT